MVYENIIIFENSAVEDISFGMKHYTLNGSFKTTV